MASLTAMLGPTWPSGDIGLESEDLQEERLRPVAVFPWQDPGNGESAVRIVPVGCRCSMWVLGPRSGRGFDPQGSSQGRPPAGAGELAIPRWAAESDPGE